MSTKYPLFVSKWSQARITIRYIIGESALSLLAGPRKREANRIDTGYARGREYSGLPFGSGLGLVFTRVRCGSTTALKEGGEFRRDENPSPNGGRCGASCLAPNSGGEEIEARLEFEA